MELDFEIDKITESIEDAETGERVETLILPMRKVDLYAVSKKKGWGFGFRDWRKELSLSERQVYKLVTEKEPDIIEGVVSFEVKYDHVYMWLIENAPYNIGRKKKYLGVACNMVAYGCILSKEAGFGGEMAFRAKTNLIHHYVEDLGAVHIGGGLMHIYEKRAKWLINQYFPENREVL